MLVSITSALSNLDERFQHVDFDGIQQIVNTFSDPKTRDAAKADPHNFMIKEMKKNNVPIPDGLHFHWREGTTLYPPEASDVVSPPSRLVLAAAPNKPFELETIQVRGTVIAAGFANLCRFCTKCVVVVVQQ